MNSKKEASRPFSGFCSTCSSGVRRPHLLRFLDFEGDGDCEISLSDMLLDRSFMSWRKLSPRFFFCTFVINLSFGCTARGISSLPGEDTNPAARDHQLSRLLSGDRAFSRFLSLAFVGLMLPNREGFGSKVAGIVRKTLLSGVASLSIIDDCSGDFGVPASDMEMSTSSAAAAEKTGPDLKEEKGVFGPNDLMGDEGFEGEPKADLVPIPRQWSVSHATRWKCTYVSVCYCCPLLGCQRIVDSRSVVKMGSAYPLVRFHSGTQSP